MSRSRSMGSDICRKCMDKGCLGFEHEITECESFVPQTNADRIRAMTDEELADFINDTEYGFIDRPGMCDVCDHHRIKDCKNCWLDWLKSPVEVNNG